MFNHCVEGGRYATHFRLPESAEGKFGFPAQSLGMGEPGFFEKGVPQQMTVGIRNIWEYDDTALDLVNLWYFQSSPTSAGDKMN